MSNGEKKQQRKALVSSVKQQLKVIQLGLPDCKEATVSLPYMPDMNEDNIKPIFFDVLGYTPEIVSFEIMHSVAIITIRMK